MFIRSNMGNPLWQRLKSEFSVGSFSVGSKKLAVFGLPMYLINAKSGQNLCSDHFFVYNRTLCIF
jgi:hypothetical protein